MLLALFACVSSDYEIYAEKPDVDPGLVTDCDFIPVAGTKISQYDCNPVFDGGETGAGSRAGPPVQASFQGYDSFGSNSNRAGTATMTTSRSKVKRAQNNAFSVVESTFEDMNAFESKIEKMREEEEARQAAEAAADCGGDGGEGR